MLHIQCNHLQINILTHIIANYLIISDYNFDMNYFLCDILNHTFCFLFIFTSVCNASFFAIALNEDFPPTIENNAQIFHLEYFSISLHPP